MLISSSRVVINLGKIKQTPHCYNILIDQTSALDIERELLEHPDIAEVAVLGIPDTSFGITPFALSCVINTDYY